MSNAWVLSMDGQIMALYQSYELANKDKDILKNIHPNSSFDIENWCVNNNLVFSPAWDKESNTIKF